LDLPNGSTPLPSKERHAQVACRLLRDGVLSGLEMVRVGGVEMMMMMEMMMMKMMMKIMKIREREVVGRGLGSAIRRANNNEPRLFAKADGRRGSGISLATLEITGKDLHSKSAAIAVIYDGGGKISRRGPTDRGCIPINIIFIDVIYVDGSKNTALRHVPRLHTIQL